MAANSGKWMFRLARAAMVGLVLAVLVAWGCVLWSSSTRTTKPTAMGADGWPVPIAGPAGEGLGYWSHERGVGFDKWSSLIGRGTESGFLYWRGSVAPTITEAGLPMRCLRSEVRAYRAADGSMPRRWDLPPHVIVGRGLNTSDLPGWVRARPQRRLPMMPIVGGLLVNAAVFGAFYLLLERTAVTLNRPEHDAGK